jgi:hypothetical protein
VQQFVIVDGGDDIFFCDVSLKSESAQSLTGRSVAAVPADTNGHAG